MKIAISQPTYLPWMGYFDLMDQVDHFVFLDTVQFTKRSWQQRNKIKCLNDLTWLTVPVKVSGLYDQSIKDVAVENSSVFKKHSRAIEQNYRKAKYFDLYFPMLNELFDQAASGLGLCEINIQFIKFFADSLGIKTKTSRSSDFNFTAKRSELLALICERLGSTEYLSALGSIDYLAHENSDFSERGITITFQNYEHPSYTQINPPFKPYASVLDLLLNEGPHSLRIIKSGRKIPFGLEEAARRNQEAEKMHDV
jgi:hypothetical protein